MRVFSYDLYLQAGREARYVNAPLEHKNVHLENKTKERVLD